MFFLPLVERELRMAAHRRNTYWTRFWAALIAIAVSFWMVLFSRQPGAQLSRPMFVTLTIMAFAYCLLAGVRYTADCLSEEKREGTLGFLFLTDLRGYDVVFSKLVVTSLQALFGLLAVLPVFGLPVLLGGVTGAEFWRMSLLLVNTLFLSLALGLLISALGREERFVTLGTLLTVVLFAFGLPALWKLATMRHDSPWFDRLLLFPSPSYAYKMAGSGIFWSRSSDFWPAMATIWGIALACLVASSFVLPRVFQEKAASAWAARWQERFLRWRFYGSERGERRRKHLLGLNPFLWLVSRDRLPKVCFWIFALLVGAFTVWVYRVVVKKQYPLMNIAAFGSLGLHLFLKVLVAAEACRRINEDKRSGALEMLLSTGLNLNSVLQAQMTALRGIFRLPIFALLALNFVWVFAINEKEPAWVIFGGAVILMFDVLALGWVGMRLALKGQRYHRTVFSAVGRVMFPAWAVLAGFIFLDANSGLGQRGADAFFFWWFVLSAIYDLKLVVWAKATAKRDAPLHAPNVRWEWTRTPAGGWRMRRNAAES